MGLLAVGEAGRAGGAEFGIQVGGSHTWTSGVSAVLRMGKAGLCFLEEPEGSAYGQHE